MADGRAGELALVELVIGTVSGDELIVAALALSDESVGLDDFAASEACTAPGSRVAVVLGTEGDGLSRRTIVAADEVVRIPMAGGVDSLNVAAAAAVAFWALRMPR